MNTMFAIAKENLEEVIEKIILDPIESLDDNLWSTINSGYVKELKEQESKIKDILVNGFKTDENEYDGRLSKFEDDIYNFAKRTIERTCRDLNSHLNRKFDLYFKRDDKGKHRNWKDISEEKINQLHEE